VLEIAGEYAVFDWLFEGRPTAYMLLGMAAALMVVMWWLDRKRRWLISIGAIALLAFAYFLLDRLVETGREQIRRRLGEMAKAVQENKPDAVMTHVSDRFQWEGLNKQEFEERMRQSLPRVEKLILWDFRFLNGWPPPDGQPVRVDFQAKAIGAFNPQGLASRCEADFVRDPDGAWRLQNFRVFEPGLNNTTPFSIRQHLGK
jgi:hypothetical protein